MEVAIQSLINPWIEQHPFIAWLLQHPIISLVSLFLIVVLLFRLFSAIAQLLDRLWIWLLKSPVLLIKSLLGLKKESPEIAAIINSNDLAIDPEKITQIIQQLEIINQQQKQIMEDIAVLKQKQDNSVVN
ncbi:conserved hypothetical protein [Hyella patelloides LEGE 07179]|uniref:Uncharacterized protein n=1 Tax=Hyella patelloides LEGE 07179 TaxID=945734 RepID=A0A563VMT8_9CYAN|nr:hypothetical protein [Hyella patelloides]VEP12749.1 conserved hypothetical protein [Hyella patelloides LEGE 07179]